MALMELGPERRWQETLYYRWLRPEIDEQPSLDLAFNDRNTHVQQSTRPPAVAGIVPYASMMKAMS